MMLIVEHSRSETGNCSHRNPLSDCYSSHPGLLFISKYQTICNWLWKNNGNMPTSMTVSSIWISRAEQNMKNGDKIVTPWHVYKYTKEPSCIHPDTSLYSMNVFTSL